MLGHAAFIRRKNMKSKCSDFSNTCHIRRRIAGIKRVMIKNVTHFKMNRFPDLNFEYIVF